jgi:ABC-type uncharacterized transport system involved in gliding motility auxiliary subunit
MKSGSDGFWKVMGGLAGLAVFLVLLVAANVIVGRTRIRADLTREKLYSLSDGSRAILGKLDRRVTLKLFFSSSSTDVPPFLKNYAREVEDLLYEYALAANGKIKIEKYDPKPDSEAEEWAQRYGLQGSPVQMFGPPVYFGLVADCGGVEGALPTIDPRAEQLLEYNITRLVYRITHPEKPVIGVMSSLPVLGGGMGMMMRQRPEQQAWIAFRNLREDYVIKEIPPTVEEIARDVNALIVVHPKNLSDKALYAIDQFVLRGGKLMALVDPFSVAELESNPQNQMGISKTSSNMEKLFSAWGVSFDDGKVLADLNAATTIQTGDNNVEESPVFLTISTNNLNGKDILTAQVGRMMLPFAGTLSCSTNSGLKITPLITSSSKAGTVDAVSARFGSAAIRNSLKMSDMKMDVAVRLSGKFRTAFPGGKPKDPNSTNATTTVEAGLTSGESTVILIADTDIIADRFCVEEMNYFGAKGYRPVNDNLNFFMNAVGQIVGSQDLVGIRCRGTFNRPFDRVVALERKAVQQWQEKESELERRLKDTQQQLAQLENSKDESQKFILSDEQKKAIDDFRARQMDIKKELKSVRKNLRSDIEKLGVEVKVVNMALMPVLVCIAGIVFWLYRKHRK